MGKNVVVLGVLVIAVMIAFSGCAVLGNGGDTEYVGTWKLGGDSSGDGANDYWEVFELREASFTVKVARNKNMNPLYSAYKGDLVVSGNEMTFNQTHEWSDGNGNGLVDEGEWVDSTRSFSSMYSVSGDTLEMNWDNGTTDQYTKQ